MKSLLSILLTLSLYSPVYAAKKNIEGTYQVLVLDQENGSSETQVSIIETKSNKRIKLKGKKHKRFATGDLVSISGELQANEMEVETMESSETGTIGIASVTETTVEKTVLSVIVDFADAPSHMTQASLPSILSNTSLLFSEMSFGKIKIGHDKDGDGTPDIFRVQLLDKVSTSACQSDDYIGWRDSAITALSTQGVSTTGYSNIVLYLPETVPCSWAGVAFVGSLRSRNLMTSWVKQESLPNPRVTTHELGHNFGLRHAGKDVDNNGVLENDYTDSSCFMSSYLRGANGPHMVELGAFEDHAHSVKEMTAREGYFILAASDIKPTVSPHPHVLKVVKKITSPTDISYYYLSYKRGVGLYDRNLASTYKVGVSIHSQKEAGDETYYIKTLAPATEFRDDANSVMVKMIEKSADGSTIKVWVRQVNPACTFGVPWPSASAIEMNNNSSLSTTAMIRNSNSSACKTSLFDVTTVSSSADLSSTITEKVSLAPGQSVSAGHDLETNHNYGNHTVTIKAKEVADGTSYGTTTIPVTVKAVVPAAPTYLATSVTSPNLILKWRASSSPSIASYKVYRQFYDSTTVTLEGTVTGLSFSQTLPSKRATYYVKALDLAGVSSGPSSQAVFTPPSTVSAPGNFTLTETSPDVVLNWSVPESTVSLQEYRVYRRNFDVTEYTQIATVAQPSFTQPMPTVKVYYKVKAVDVYGRISLYSDWKSYTPDTSLVAASNLALTASGLDITLTWTAANSSVGVEKYQVFRKLYGETSYRLLDTGTDLSYTETRQGGPLSYFVRVYDVYGYYKSSASVTYTPVTTLSAASNLVLTPAAPNITLKWTAATSSEGVQKYQVYRKLYGESSYVLRSSITSLSHTESLPSVPATYYVKVYDIYGSSETSATTSYTPPTTLSAPSNLSVTVGSSNLTVKWAAATASAGVQKYQVYRKLDGASTFQLMKSTSYLSYSETFPTVPATYQVTVIDNYGWSKTSSTVTYTPATGLTAPSNLSISVAKPNLTLKWSAASSSVGIEKYQVYRKLSNASSYELRSTVTTTSYTETLPTVSATFYVISFDKYGNSKTSTTRTYTK
ncbi:MAG TPA: M12 family metallo-peptidase [Bacteriovoracaceae bacterium]|nr:M12 family metallo-peptidase [Bacteriovoracaceae bacterium]